MERRIPPLAVSLVALVSFDIGTGLRLRGFGGVYRFEGSG